MNYLKYIGFYFIQSLIAPINLILSIIGLSTFVLDWDLDWLALIAVKELKHEHANLISVKEYKQREAEELANLAIKRMDDPNG